MSRGALGLVGVLLAACTPLPPAPDVPPPTRADAIVVLGNRPPVDERGQVRPELRRRVETGVRLWKEGRAPLLVMTGGPAPSGHVEAEVMRDLAIELGVRPEAIRTEGRSRDTIENAGFTLAALCADDATCEPRVLLVSSPFHLPRAEALFECAGARVAMAPTPLPEDEPGYAERFSRSEGFVRFAYAFVDECGRARAARAR
ncbi:MAG: YdcF family protein [Sandaracinus sp.]|nr:YdcF family protein [Sandaracinus sp.]MCB9620079.1 YdcF family protein [Sandaracinus sp.]MCB9625154.1 YdcF family protein [Sandaracinus sp.]